VRKVADLPARGNSVEDEDEDDFDERPTGVMFDEPPAGTADGGPVSLSAAPSLPVTPSAPPEVPDAQLQERLREVDELYERLGELDHYSLLGITPAADEDGVRSAYFQLARRFHPDAYFRKPIGAHRQKLELIFKMLTRAHEVLRSDEQRAAYDAAHGITRPPVVPDVAPEPAPTMSKTSAVFPRARPSQSKPPVERSGVVSTRPAAPSAPAPAARPAAARPAPAITTPPPASKLSQPSLRPPVITHSQAPAPSSSTGSSPGVSRSSPPARPSAREALLKSLEARRIRPAAPGAANSQAPGPAQGSPLEAIISDLSRRPDAHTSWAMPQLRKAAQHERAGELDQVVAILQAVMVRVSDPRLRELRDKVHKQALQKGASEHKNLAMQAEQSKNLKEAAEHWRKVLEAEPNDARAALRAGACLLKAGEVKQAGQFAKRAVELAPGDVNARKLALRFYEAMGMTLNATREREAVAKLEKK
jgi:hypothetical protein